MTTQQMNPVKTYPCCGPLIGHVGPTSARLWMLPPSGSTVEVRYGPDWGAGPQGDGRSVSTVAGAVAPSPVVLTLSGLTPDSTTYYQVFIDGVTEETLGGRFRSAPLPGSKGRFTFATSSCMKTSGWRHDDRQQAWDVLVERDPSFQILLGDNVYANSTDPVVQWKKHIRQRQLATFARAIRRVPTYAIWDDHDFGPNDADGREPGKERSLDVFGRVWANREAPEGTPIGTSNTWSWGDVDFFLVDGRYHRDDRRGQMLGEEQFTWLERQLEASTATFKFIGSGSCLQRGSNGWKRYPRERARFLELLRGTEGAVYLSGDVHYCHFDEVTLPDGRILHDFISSGIGRRKVPFKKPSRRFVTVKVDTSVPDPTIDAVIWSRKGNVKGRKQLRHSDLRG